MGSPVWRKPASKKRRAYALDDYVLPIAKKLQIMEHDGKCNRGRKYLAISVSNPHDSQGNLTSRTERIKSTLSINDFSQETLDNVIFGDDSKQGEDEKSKMKPWKKSSRYVSSPHSSRKK
jgi:hypothetical protein